MCQSFLEPSGTWHEGFCIEHHPAYYKKQRQRINRKCSVQTLARAFLLAGWHKSCVFCGTVLLSSTFGAREVSRAISLPKLRIQSNTPNHPRTLRSSKLALISPRFTPRSEITARWIANSIHSTERLHFSLEYSKQMWTKKQNDV